LVQLEFLPQASLYFFSLLLSINVIPEFILLKI